MRRKHSKYEIVVGIKLPRNRSVTTSLSKLIGVDRIYRSKNGYLIIEVDEEILPQATRLVRKLLRDLDLDVSDFTLT